MSALFFFLLQYCSTFLERP